MLVTRLGKADGWTLGGVEGKEKGFVLGWPEGGEIG